MKTELPWQTDANGMVLGARIHDGYLIGLSCSDGDALSFRVRRVDGGIALVELSSLGDFNIGLWNTPIIGTMYAWKVDSVPDSGWNALYSPISAVKERAAKVIKERPGSFLVMVDTSYGGELAAVCGAFKIFEESSAPASKP